MASTEWTVTTRVVIVLTTLRVTRPVDTARRPVKHHSSLLSANHVRTNKLTAFIVDFFWIPFAANFASSFSESVLICYNVTNSINL